MRLAKLSTIGFWLLLPVVGAGPATANYTTVRQLYVFDCSGGTCPSGESPAALLLSADGNFYGVTGNGGAGNGAGTVFRLSSDFRRLTTLYTFQPDKDGNHPNGAWPTGLVDGNDGNLYGTTVAGGTDDAGVIFRLSKTGHFKLLHSLCPSCGESADAEFLVKGPDGNFYGDSYGVLFRITPQGKFKVLHAFNSEMEGADALGLTLASNGDFYGTTLGASSLLTTLFRLKPRGRFDVLQTFHYSDFATTVPIQALDGHLYAVVTHDGDDDGAGLFRSNLAATRLHVPPLEIDSHDMPIHFGFMQDSAGTLWGGVYSGNDYPDGALLGWSTTGELQYKVVLDGSNGAYPAGPLIETGDGTLVGLASAGGTAANGDTAAGTIFKLK